MVARAMLRSGANFSIHQKLTLLYFPRLSQHLRSHIHTNSSEKRAYDLVCIGTGPSAVACAVDTAKRGKSVAMIERPSWVGGVSVKTGTIPSRTFRETVIYASQLRHSIFKTSETPPMISSAAQIMDEVNQVVQNQTLAVHRILQRHGIDLIYGTAKFEDENTLLVSTSDSQDARNEESHRVCAEKIFIGVGTKPVHIPGISFDGVRVFDSDQFLKIPTSSYPRRLIVWGAGVIGVEYASMLSTLPGTSVTIIDNRSDILSFVDKEIIETLKHLMRQSGARLLLDEKISSVQVDSEGDGAGVTLNLASGKVVKGDSLLYAAGRLANTSELGLDNVGLDVDERGMILVNPHYQTNSPNIYAGGDCIGFPALASTSNEQGKLASEHMWLKDSAVISSSQLKSDTFPYGIYTIPEISMVGKTEAQLTAQNISYEVGISRFGELAKAQMLGGQPGMLKIIFCPETKKIYGVHVIGEGATEIIHIGQAAMAMGSTLDFFRDAVFNYPTLAEAYRVAAIHGLGKLSTL